MSDTLLKYMAKIKSTN